MLVPIHLDMKQITSQAPNAWKDFLDFYREHYDNSLPTVTSLPFSMQIGVLIEYFNDNGIEVELHHPELIAIKEALEEAFILQENNLSHYS